MVSVTRSGKRYQGSARKTVGDDFRNFKSLLSVFLSPEGMKPLVLNKLYQLLIYLSSNAQWIAKHSEVSLEFGLEICHDGIKVTCHDICELSDVLYKELDRRFEEILRNFSTISANRDQGVHDSSSGLLDDFEVMILLFRCCMLLLPLLDPQQNLILEKGQILLRILRNLNFTNVVKNKKECSYVFEKSIFHESPSSSYGYSTSSFEDFTASLQFLEPYDPLHFFMSTMLEVFIDELLMKRQLRVYLKIIKSFASSKETLFNLHSAQGDIAVVIEVMCNHFLLSFSDEHAAGDFLNRLFSMNSKEAKYTLRAPALGVTTATSLLLNPILVSAPKYMQAHLIFLVSEAININVAEPDRNLTNCFLSMFEKSVILYIRYMSCPETGICSTFTKDFTLKSSTDISCPLFESFILPETKHKVDSLITKLDNSSDLMTKGCSLGMKSDLVNSSMRFVKECSNVCGISCEDDVLAILSCLVLRASESCDENTPLQLNDDTNLQHICFLASLLRLMCLSLVQAIRCLRQSDDFNCSKTLKDFSSCKEYDFILAIIACFKDFPISLPFQKSLSNEMFNHFPKHMDSKVMFLHFSGLMSLSFASGIDCLVKGCLLILFALLNLFLFEEGSLDIFRSFVDSPRNSLSSGLPIALDKQNTSIIVASKFQKIRSLYQRDDMEEETEELSNGEIFLKCVLGKQENVSDFEDLASFVECKRGKNYSAWLKNRQKFRKWRFEKMAVVKWERKKKTWRNPSSRRRD